MKTIEVDEELYGYIAKQTQHIGESASTILRRILKLAPLPEQAAISADGISEHDKTNLTPSQVNYRLLYLNEQVTTGNIRTLKKAIDRFLSLLSILYSLDTAHFEKAVSTLTGRTRIYFAKDKQTLLQHGRQTKPRQIPNTPYWVITNNSSNRKGKMINHIMSEMQLPQAIIEKAVDLVSNIQNN